MSCTLALRVTRYIPQNGCGDARPDRLLACCESLKTRSLRRIALLVELGLASDALRTPRTLSCLLLGKALGETARASVAARADVTGLRRHCAERHTLSRHRQRRCQTDVLCVPSASASLPERSTREVNVSMASVSGNPAD